MNNLKIILINIKMTFKNIFLEISNSNKHKSKCIIPKRTSSLSLYNLLYKLKNVNFYYNFNDNFDYNFDNNFDIESIIDMYLV